MLIFPCQAQLSPIKTDWPACCSVIWRQNLKLPHSLIATWFSFGCWKRLYKGVPQCRMEFPLRLTDWFALGVLRPSRPRGLIKNIYIFFFFLFCDIWHVTFDMWHVTRRHKTRATWHVTSDTWHVTSWGRCTFCQNFNSLALMVWSWRCFEDLEEKGDLVTELVT